MELAQTASHSGIIVTPCMHVTTDMHAMVSFQGGVSKPKHIIAGSIEVQMLAVAIRHGWKLRNIDLCAVQ
jgi:hypothetical protein